MFLILSLLILAIPISYIIYNYYKYKNLRKFKQNHHKPPKGDKIIMSFDNLIFYKRMFNHFKIWLGICFDPMGNFIESKKAYEENNTKIMLWFSLQFVSEKGSDSENNFKKCCETMKIIRGIIIFLVSFLVSLLSSYNFLN